MSNIIEKISIKKTDVHYSQNNLIIGIKYIINYYLSEMKEKKEDKYVDDDYILEVSINRNNNKISYKLYEKGLDSYGDISDLECPFEVLEKAHEKINEIDVALCNGVLENKVSIL